MSNQKTIREEITTKIVTALEKDLLPWRRPWSTNNAGRHTNVISKKPYSGVNPMLLELHSMEFGFQSRWWQPLISGTSLAASSSVGQITFLLASGAAGSSSTCP
jgi:antirestriction protein ArdC